MTYEDEHGPSDRLATLDEYGTPPQGYAAVPYGPLPAPGGPDEQSEPGSDWPDPVPPHAQAPGAPGADGLPYAYWPAAEGAGEGPGNWPSAGAPPEGAPPAGGPSDSGAPKLGHARPGGLHAPLPATEHAYVDWIKGLGTADAAQEQWATAADPRLDDEDDADGDDEDGFPEDWPGFGPQAQDDDVGDETTAEQWADDSAQVPAQAGLDGEENWFEPKRREDGGDGYEDEPSPQHDGPAGGFGPGSPPAADGRPGEDEDWFEPKQRPDDRDAMPAIGPGLGAAPFGAPAQFGRGADWPRSAAELDYVTPGSAAGEPAAPGFGTADFAAATLATPDRDAGRREPEGYDNAGYENAGYDNAGYDNPRRDAAGYDAAGYDNPRRDPAEYDNEGYDKAGYGATVYGTGGYDPDRRDATRHPGSGYGRPDGGSPDGVPGLDRSGNDETTTLLVRGDGGPRERRRKPQSYRPYAIGAAVLAIAVIALVWLALRDSSTPSVGTTTPQSTVNPAPVLPADLSPSPTASSDPSASVSPSASPTPASPTARPPARPTPRRTMPAPPNPPHTTPPTTPSSTPASPSPSDSPSPTATTP
jgi:hypothetical protein